VPMWPWFPRNTHHLLLATLDVDVAAIMFSNDIGVTINYHYVWEPQNMLRPEDADDEETKKEILEEFGTYGTVLQVC